MGFVHALDQSLRIAQLLRHILVVHDEAEWKTRVRDRDSRCMNHNPAGWMCQWRHGQLFEVQRQQGFLEMLHPC